MRRRSSIAVWLDEARHASRSIRRRPLISVVATLSLALGLGLAILTIAIVDAILIRPLSFPASDELLFVYAEFRPESGANFPRSAVSAPEILDYAAASRTVDVGAYRPQAVSFGEGDGTPERVPAARLTSAAFRILGTAPALGRVFAGADDGPGAPCAVVLSHGLWQERFAGARDVIGRTVRIDGAPCDVAGVMPREFAFPNQAARMWLPLAVDPNPSDRGSHGLVAIGRLRGAVTMDAAQQELRVLMARWAETMPHHKGHGLVIAPYKDELIGPVQQELKILAGAVALLLAAIVANLSSLLLAHGSARRRELAVRTALGASRASLMRQLLCEGWMLAIAGGIFAMAIASVALEPLLAAYPAALPRASEVHIDARTVGLAVLASVLVGTVVAWLPAIRLTRGFGPGDLNAGDRRTGTALTLRTERLLVIGELAIGVTVAVGALLLTQSFAALARVPLGFDPGGATAAIIGVPAPGRPDEWPQQFFAKVTTELASAPGIEAAGAISSLPLLNAPPPDIFTVEGRRVARPSEPGLIADYLMVTPGAFEALRIDMLRGRAISPTDTATTPAVAVINETLARQQWSGDDPIGRRIRYAESVSGDDWGSWGPWITIVGIAGDIRSVAPSAPPRPAIYVAHAQRPRTAYDGRTMSVVIRSDGVDVAALLRRAIRDHDAGASLSAVRTMETIVGAAIARPRFMGGLMTLFATIALVVAALGVYGVVAYGVAQRTRDIGVKLALGASPGRIAAGLGRHTMGMLLGGLMLGLAGAAALASGLQTMLFGVQPFGAAPYAIVAAVLTMAVSAAAALPLRRAMRIDPLRAMRLE